MDKPQHKNLLVELVGQIQIQVEIQIKTLGCDFSQDIPQVLCFCKYIITLQTGFKKKKERIEKKEYIDLKERIHRLKCRLKRTNMPS